MLETDRGDLLFWTRETIELVSNERKSDNNTRFQESDVKREIENSLSLTRD